MTGAKNRDWVTWEYGNCASGFSHMGLTCPHFTSHPSLSAACLGHLQILAGGFYWILSLLYNKENELFSLYIIVLLAGECHSRVKIETL